MRSVILALVVTLALAATTRASSPPPVTYTLTPLFKAGALTGVEIETRFQADADGVTDLRLPSRDRGHGQLYTALKDLTVAGARSVASPAPEARRITSAPGASITVRYRLDANLTAGQATTTPGLPAIGPDSLYLIGRTVFSEVMGRGSDPVRFRWRGTRGWRFVSDLEHQPDAMTWRDMAMSVIMAGPDLHIVRLDLPHTRLWVATLGGPFGFSARDFNGAVMKVIATEQAFWGDGHKDFLVALAPLRDPSGDTLEGQGLEDAFTLMASPGIGMPQTLGLLAHEYFHSWNPFQLGGQEAGGAWFAEGFTEYYARRLALRGGVTDLDGFTASWNTALASYAASPQRNASNSALTAGRFKNPDLEALAYDRGSIFAALTEARLRGRGTGLDAVMLALRDRARVDPKFPSLNARERLVQAAPAMEAESRRFIVEGETILLPPDAFGGCLTVRTEDVPVFDLGFDLDRSAANGWVFAGVRPDSAAWRAGLRDGMKRIARVSGEPNQSDIPVTFKVRDGVAERTITYRPEGAAQLTRQRVVIPENLDAAAKAACAKVIAG